jgi:hypothetical protein
VAPDSPLGLRVIELENFARVFWIPRVQVGCRGYPPS